MEKVATDKPEKEAWARACLTAPGRNQLCQCLDLQFSPPEQNLFPLLRLPTLGYFVTAALGNYDRDISTKSDNNNKKMRHVSSVKEADDTFLNFGTKNRMMGKRESLGYRGKSLSSGEGRPLCAGAIRPET